MSNWGRQFLQNFCGVATESQGVLPSTHMLTNAKLGSPVFVKLLWCCHRVAGSDLLTSHPLRLCFVDRLVLSAFWTKWQHPCLQKRQCARQLSGLHSAREQRRLLTVYAMPSPSKLALREFQMILLRSLLRRQRSLAKLAPQDSQMCP